MYECMNWVSKKRKFTIIFWFLLFKGHLKHNFSPTDMDKPLDLQIRFFCKAKLFMKEYHIICKGGSIFFTNQKKLEEAPVPKACTKDLPKITSMIFVRG